MAGMQDKNAEPKKTENILADIQLEDSEKLQESVFKKFKSESEVGNLIIKDYMAYAYKIRKNMSNGFFLSEDNKGEIGLITQCYGIQTIYALYMFGADISEYTKQILETTEDILKRTEDGKYRPTPYLVQEIEEEEIWGDAFVGKYTDSIALVLSSLVEVREIVGFSDLIKDTKLRKELFLPLRKSIV